MWPTRSIELNDGDLARFDKCLKKQFGKNFLISHLLNATSNCHIPLSAVWHVENHTGYGQHCRSIRRADLHILRLARRPLDKLRILAVTNLYYFVNELGMINSVVACRELEPETEYQLTSFNEIEFVCVRGIFTVVADDELDTVSLKLAENPKQFKRDISGTDPWIRAIEKPIHF